MIDWNQSAGEARDGLLEAAVTCTYTPRGGVSFTAPMALTKPNDSDLTAGISVEMQKFKAPASDFVAASGGKEPRRGAVITTPNGKRYEIRRVFAVRRGGVDHLFNIFAEG